MLSRLLIAALWSPAGKGLTSWPLFVMFNCVLSLSHVVSLGQVWHLIVSIPDLCRLSYYDMNANHIVSFNFNRISFSYNASAYIDQNQNWCVLGYVKVQKLSFHRCLGI